MNSNNGKENYSLEKLYPDYTSEDIAEAKDTLKRYLDLVWRIYNRARVEEPQKLTETLLNARFKHPRQKS